MTAPATVAAPTALDELTLQQHRRYARLVNAGIATRGNDARNKWHRGDLAVRVAKLWDRESSIIAFAEDIGMRRPRTIYDWYHTSKEFPRPLRNEILAECPRLRTEWSLFRTATRHAHRLRKEGEEVTPEMLCTWMATADTNEMDADEFGAFLKAGEPDYITKKERLQAQLVSVTPEGELVLCLDPRDAVKVSNWRDNRKFAVRLGISWEELAVKENTKA